MQWLAEGEGGPRIYYGHLSLRFAVLCAVQVFRTGISAVSSSVASAGEEHPGNAVPSKPRFWVIFTVTAYPRALLYSAAAIVYTTLHTLGYTTSSIYFQPLRWAAVPCPAC